MLTQRENKTNSNAFDFTVKQGFGRPLKSFVGCNITIMNFYNIFTNFINSIIYYSTTFFAAHFFFFFLRLTAKIAKERLQRWQNTHDAGQFEMRSNEELPIR